MRIKMTFEFDTDFRKAFAICRNIEGAASREDLKAWIEGLVTTASEDVAFEASETRIAKGRE